MSNLEQYFARIIFNYNLKSYPRFYQYLCNDASSKLTTKNKGDLFEVLCKYIFKLHPYFVHRTKNVWLYADIPIDIKRKLNLSTRDDGIDLL